MSSGPVRASYKAAVAAAFPTVPIVDTVAVRVDADALPDDWIALDFDAGVQTRTSIGGPGSLWRETGTVYVAAVVLTGAGDAALITRADLVAAVLRNYQDPLIGLRPVTVEIGAAANEDSDGRWFWKFVSCGYERTFHD
jgi:hypothetical protein